MICLQHVNHDHTQLSIHITGIRISLERINMDGLLEKPGLDCREVVFLGIAKGITMTDLQGNEDVNRKSIFIRDKTTGGECRVNLPFSERTTQSCRMIGVEMGEEVGRCPRSFEIILLKTRMLGKLQTILPNCQTYENGVGNINLSVLLLLWHCSALNNYIRSHASNLLLFLC